jgi:3-hydroxyacyl-CoA dehydrogenase, C-terminal domain
LAKNFYICKRLFTLFRLLFTVAFPHFFMAIIHLLQSQPIVYLFPDDDDQRSAANIAAVLVAGDVPFHIFLDGEHDEELEPYKAFILDNIDKAPAPPHIAIDCTLQPIPLMNPFLEDVFEKYSNVTVVSCTPNVTATQIAAFSETDNIARVNLLHGFFPMQTLLEFAPSLTMKPSAQAHAEKFLENIGLRIQRTDDIVGFVTPRIVAMLVNEAAFAVMEGVSSPAEIDEAMRLGTNYPHGPLEWGDEIGLDTVLALLDALFNEYKQERYRACRLIRQYVAAGWVGTRSERGFYEYGDDEIS